MKHYVFGLALLLPMISTVAAQEAANPDLVKRGGYLVNAMGCHDCHTPFRKPGCSATTPRPSSCR